MPSNVAPERLKTITEATDGNLGRQLQTLAEAGYITVIKDYANNRPRARAELTSDGERAFADHVDYWGGLRWSSKSMLMPAIPRAAPDAAR